jgi:hypothetical protein
MSELPKLSHAQFYEWRLKIEEMQHAKVQSELLLQKMRGMEKDIEIQTLRLNIYKNSVKAAQELSKLKIDEYQVHRDKLEKELGVSLKNVTIDEVTFEIRELENNEGQQK